jgi:hypothetical protein
MTDDQPVVTPISRAEPVGALTDDAVVLVDAQAQGWYERERLPRALRATANK